MNAQGIDQDAVVHMSSTCNLLNKTVDTAKPCLECVDHSGRVPAGLPEGLGDALTMPSGKAFLDWGLTDSTIIKAHKQLFSASNRSSAFNMTCQCTYWAKQM